MPDPKLENMPFLPASRGTIERAGYRVKRVCGRMYMETSGM